MKREEYELPSFEKALALAEESLSQQHRDSATGCPHLLELLPHEINLDLVQTPDGLQLLDPVHGLHLASQDLSENPLFGDEHERMLAVRTPGLVKNWHPDQLHPSQIPTEIDSLLTKVVENAEQAHNKASLLAKPEAAIKTDSTSNSEIMPSAEDVKTENGTTEEKATKPEERPDTVSSSESPDVTLDELAIQTRKENALVVLRGQLLSKRDPRLTDPRKRKSPSENSSAKLSQRVMGSLDEEQYRKYKTIAASVNQRIGIMLENFRFACSVSQCTPEKTFPKKSLFSGPTQACDEKLSCLKCSNTDQPGLMHCLECFAVGCAPTSGRKEGCAYSQYHAVRKNHNFAVGIEPNTRIYCFQCCDYVDHPVFQYERDRIRIESTLPWLAWSPHGLFRSFNAFQFMRVPDQGIFWKGVVAAYPTHRSQQGIKAARMTYYRHCIISGGVDSIPSSLRTELMDKMKEFALTRMKNLFWRIPAPVGFYNLGNTCYQSAVIQCLVHCTEFQSFFLKDSRHNHLACEFLRAPVESGVKSTKAATKKSKILAGKNICLACEMDRVLVKYFDRSNGLALDSALLQLNSQQRETLSSSDLLWRQATDSRGEPMALTNLLAKSWKTKSMEHLKGYKQQDAHEFFHAFLEKIGKDTVALNQKICDEIDVVARKSVGDVCDLFRGTMRSVLICQKCGNKRVQKEKFTSLSVPISDGIQQGKSDGKTTEPNTLTRCLEKFTATELLADPVSCPSCKVRTETKKQHVISTLPRVLCVHLKRFDALHNKKIEDFVSFPSNDLNMGPFLSHFAEETVYKTKPLQEGTEEFPSLMYNLFGTVVHFGSINSGHYTANVKVGRNWFHTNDSFVCHSSEDLVLKENAYLLFYQRA